MGSKHVVSITMIHNFCVDHPKQLERGENAYYASGYVVEVRLDSDFKPAVLTGKVMASMKNKSYNVEISIDLDGGIVDATCHCPRGQVICHHMAVLSINAYHNISVTDKACLWNISKRAGGAEVKALKDIFPPKKANFCAVKRVATAEEINFQANLHGNIVGFSWLLQPEPQPEAFIIPEIDAIIYSADFIEAEDKARFVCDRLAITKEVRNSVMQSTIGQSNNPNWLVARKYRLTASHFGEILAACKRDRYPPSLFRNLLGGYAVSGVQAVQWGLQHEEFGLYTFTLAMGLQVVPVDPSNTPRCV